MKMLFSVLVVGLVMCGCASSPAVLPQNADEVVVHAAGAREVLRFREVHPADSQFDMLKLCFMLPADSAGWWTLPGGAVAHPNADHVTATLALADGTTRILELDAWHTLEARVPRAGNATVTLDGEPFAAWSGELSVTGTAPFMVGGKCEIHANAESAPYVMRGIPPPSAHGAFANGEGRLPKGKSLDVAHRLKVDASTPYTFVLRVRFPASSMHTWRSLYSTKKEIDGAAFVNPHDGFGITGLYPGVGLTADSVHDIAISYNGVGTSLLAWDGKVQVTACVQRAAIASGVFHLGCDNDGEDGEIEVLNWCVYPAALNARQISQLKDLAK